MGGEQPRARRARLPPYAAREATSRGRRHRRAVRRPIAASSSATATASSIPTPSAASCTRRRSSSITRATCSAPGSRTRSRWRRSRRTVARVLGLSEPLTEAICLAHDLGHTPFGHAGQDVLNECMREHGGFEHNLQSLRVVDELEDRYASFPGLNLTFETPRGNPQALLAGTCAAARRRRPERFIERHPAFGLEAQLANLADAIAYNNHDVDDGIRAGLISVEELAGRAAVRAAPRREVLALIPRVSAPKQAGARDGAAHDQRRGHATSSTRARRRIEAAASGEHRRGARAQRAAGCVLRGQGRRALRAEALPAGSACTSTSGCSPCGRRPCESSRSCSRPSWRTSRACLRSTATRRCASRPRRAPSGRARAVADYIAGMTDRYAFLEHERVLG
jgi:dGTPase